MNWTTPADIRKQVLRLWQRGKLLSSIMGNEVLFPLRIGLKTPGSSELPDKFSAVRKWIEELRGSEGRNYRIVWRELNHYVVGRNALPKEVWIDTLEGALSFISKTREARAFRNILEETQARQPELVPWLARHPLRALDAADIWPRILDVVAWIQAHPLPGIYLRQIDIPRIDTKFIEKNRSILSELMDLALPPEAIQTNWTGATGFCRRYGFRDKPLRVRFRILDPGQFIFSSCEDHDITLTCRDFASLEHPSQYVFITENETNFLSFPRISDSMVIFGGGYGFEFLGEAHWLEKRNVYYWGDIDTHGFAILDQLRSLFPRAMSWLMDRETFLAHRSCWVTEPRPELRPLNRLTDAEQRLYDDLRNNTLGAQLRLEQERIRFSWVSDALSRLQRLPQSLPLA